MAESKASKTGVTVKDVPSDEFIRVLSQHFKKTAKIELPEWHDIVKTGAYKELGPLDPDWFFIRAASLARKVYLRGGTGVGAFTKVYGGRARRGVLCEKFARSAKGVIRHSLAQLEQAGIVGKKKDKKGRWITAEGQRQLDTIAGQIASTRASSLPVAAAE